MPRFFHDNLSEDDLLLTGQDAVHIRRSLRMREGEELTVCDGSGTDSVCVITGFPGEDVALRVLRRFPTPTEPTLAVTLYQGLPKGDKLDFIVQKAVELGVTALVPVETARSVATLNEKAAKKAARWQKIANEAAGQSGRGILPTVETPLTWKQALSRLEGESILLFYEGGGEPLSRLVSPETREVSIVIGPEGGFDPGEVEALRALGAQVATLGPRILRCETAPVAALAALMTLTGNMA